MTETAIFEEQNLGFSYLELFGVYGSAIKPPPFTLSLGETYNVVWDGVEHEVMAIDTSAVIPNSIAIGNGTNWGFPGNNGPFVIVYTADSDVSFISLMDTEPSTHAVAVYRKSEDTAIYTITHATLTAIADAIRAKTGGTDKILPGDMPTAIEGITTGGGSSDDVRYVTFKNGATGEEFVKPVAVGDDCVDVVAKGLWTTPTKESDAQYDYTFYGWGAEDGGAADDTILQNITEDKVVYAIYTATVRYYTITYYDSDGVTVLHTEQLAYGRTPSYAPVKTGYTFTGWQPSVVAVTGDASYSAQWIEKLDFATIDLETIVSYAEQGKAAEVFDLGAERAISSSITAKIVGFNHDDLADGTGKAGITVMLIGYSGYTRYWNGTGGSSKTAAYPASYAYDAIADGKRVPSAFSSILKTVTKKYYNYVNKAYETIDNPYFLPALSELNYSAASKKEEGEQYEYFAGGATSRIAMLNGVACPYWTRTKTNASSGYVYVVDTEGNTKSVSQGTDNVYYPFAFACI